MWGGGYSSLKYLQNTSVQCMVFYALSAGFAVTLQNNVTVQLCTLE
jgi:hypothetical protein